MKVQDIVIYPVKSLGGISASRAAAFERGFQFDRRWMLVNPDGSLITQRDEHKLALLQCRIEQEKLIVFQKLRPRELIEIPLAPQITNTITASVWEDFVEAQELESYNEWFRSYLGKSCKLVYLPENGVRPVDPRYATRNEQVSFADAFPYLLIGQASLDNLNARLKEPIPMNRFRPNIVVKGSDAFAEDSWAEIRIGSVHFKVAKPCSRCILTTVDQQTGLQGKEPLATLAKYRKTENNKILFGQNLLPVNEGEISADDPIEVVSYKSADSSGPGLLQISLASQKPS